MDALGDVLLPPALAGRFAGTLNANNKGGAIAAAIVLPNAQWLFGATVKNTNVAAQFLFVFDAPSVPANGTAPTGPVFDLAAALGGGFEYLRPRHFFSGIVLANSSSATSFTAGLADCWFDVQYG